jgi:hypothetical protein
MRQARGLMLVLGVIGALVTAGVAAAQSTSAQLIFTGTPGAKVLSATDISLSITGQLSVSFQGDPAGGCAAYGLCPYSGTVVVRPRSGALVLLTLRRHHTVTHAADMFITPVGNGFLTVSDVQRAIDGQPSATCADGEGLGHGGTATVSGGRVTIRLLTPGGTLLSTRCAGPLDGDLAGVTPAAEISFQRAKRGRAVLDLAGSSAFAAHGFAGTVTSTLAVTLGAPQRSSSGQGFPPGIKTTQIRTVIERLGIVGVKGTLGASIQGSADPSVCQLLDSCGLTGSVSVTLAKRPVSAEVIANGPASRPYADFLAAVRDGPAAMRRGISTEVIVEWAAGTVSSDLTQPQPCTDVAPFVGAFLTLSLSGDRLAGSGGASALRTRCPGPMIGGQASLWSVRAPARGLRHRTFTIEVGPSGPLAEDGYTASPDGHLSVTVRRGPLSQSINVAPTN